MELSVGQQEGTGRAPERVERAGQRNLLGFVEEDLRFGVPFVAAEVGHKTAVAVAEMVAATAMVGMAEPQAGEDLGR
jgi:hypothetical protein